MMSSSSQAPLGEPNYQSIQKFKFTTAWVENHSPQWPFGAEALLRKCMAEWGILNHQATSTGYAMRLQNITWKLSRYIDKFGWDNNKHNNLFLLQIDRKIGQIRNETQQPQTHDIRPADAKDNHVRDVHGDLSLCIRNTSSVPVSPPCTPATRQVMLAKHDQAMKTWNTFDSELQAKTFRAQLRYAKSPEALLLEMAMFWDEVYGEPGGSPKESKTSQAAQAWTYLASLAKKAQASLDVGIEATHVDFRTKHISRGPLSEAIAEQSEDLRSATTHDTANDSRLVAGCQTQRIQSSRNRNKEEASAIRQALHQEEATLQNGFKEEYPSEMTGFTSAKCCIPRESCLPRTDKVNQIIHTPLSQEVDEIITSLKQERDSSPPPSLDLRTMTGVPMKGAQLKKARKANNEKEIHTNKRIKVEE